MKLLLAEDERELSHAVATILEYSGYEVDPAYDGQEALEKAIANQYDGMILDIMMPKRDGISVLTEVRQRGDATPILMLTAKAEVEDKVAGLDKGANDYLTKPFVMKELLARVRAMTRTVENQLPEEIQLGKVTLFRSKLEMEGEISSISLNKQEFQMLELFMNNPGKIFEREQLREKIWGQEATEGIVKMYISYLHHKLDAVGAGVDIRESSEDHYILEMIA